MSFTVSALVLFGNKLISVPDFKSNFSNDEHAIYLSNENDEALIV